MSNFVGYSGQVWRSVYASMDYYLSRIDAAVASGTPSAVSSLSTAMLETALNALSAIQANNVANSWTAAASTLDQIAILPLPINPTDAAYFNNRLAAYNSASSGIAAIVPQPPFGIPAQLLSQGQPAISDPGLIEFYENFDYETPPAPLTSTNFTTQASGVVVAFNDILLQLQIFQGTFPTGTQDTAFRESAVADAALYFLESGTSGGVASDVVTTGAWNQIITLPAMSMCAAILGKTPDLYTNQQDLCIRAALATMAIQISTFLLALSRPQTNQAALTTLLVGESLMDVAARTLGDFEQWQIIATLNGLVPPYTGPAGSPNGVAVWGSQLLLPTPGTKVSAAGTAISYFNNVLGTDLYVGPINGDMPAWTGDFQTISGYNNLAWALGRRLQTALSSLIYHSNYGSRIPAEIGMVQDSTSVGHVAAFGKSALLSDPRVQSVVSALAATGPILPPGLLSNPKLQALLSATATSGPNFSIAFQGVVQPIGIGSKPIGVNEVISPVR